MHSSIDLQSDKYFTSSGFTVSSLQITMILNNIIICCELFTYAY